MNDSKTCSYFGKGYIPPGVQGLEYPWCPGILLTTPGVQGNCVLHVNLVSTYHVNADQVQTQ